MRARMPYPFQVPSLLRPILPHKSLNDPDANVTSGMVPSTIDTTQVFVAVEKSL